VPSQKSASLVEHKRASGVHQDFPEATMLHFADGLRAGQARISLHYGVIP